MYPLTTDGELKSPIGKNFYDPDIVELLVTAMMTIAWALFVYVSAYFRDPPDPPVRTVSPAFAQFTNVLMITWCPPSGEN